MLSQLLRQAGCFWGLLFLPLLLGVDVSFLLRDLLFDSEVQYKLVSVGVIRGFSIVHFL